MSGLKQNQVLSFDDGLLIVKISGHGDANGWGELAFHERQSELDADGFRHFEIPPSELAALRDFLNRIMPVSTTQTKLYAETTKVRCCSAASPCNHQKRFPRTVCQVCHDAAHTPDKGREP